MWLSVWVPWCVIRVSDARGNGMERGTVALRHPMKKEVDGELERERDRERERERKRERDQMS